MKKNGLLTFIFACIPGAGQMYYGYMKRGLALISIFCIGVGLGAIISPLIIVCPIVWMYSFFDTYDLIRHMTQGDPKPDTLLPFENLDSLRRLFPSGNRVIGWVFIGLGAWALYSSIIEPLVINFIGWYAANMVPTLVVAALLIAGGFWLLKGPRGGRGSGPDDTFGTGPAPQWPRAGVHPRTGEGAPRPEAGAPASDEGLNADDTAGADTGNAR